MEDVTSPPVDGGQNDKNDLDVPPARRALVKQWLDRIKAAKEHHKNAFKRMRENMDFAARGADKSWVESGRYTVPILNRHINLAVSQLYAKNPTAIAKRKRKLLYSVWDGRPDSAQAAMESALLGDPNALAIVQEIMAAQQFMLLTDRMGETMVTLWNYYLSEQEYNYKQQLKAMVRRTKVTGVGYVKLGFQRLLEPRPEITGRISDVTSQISALEAGLKDMAEGEIDEESPRMEELRTLLRDLQGQEMLIAREGPVLDFPRSTEIIIDPACRHLKSLAGARWLAHEFEMTADDIMEVYKVDVKSTATCYHTDGRVWDSRPGEDDREKVKHRVYEVQDKRNRQCLVVVDGHPDFIKEPYPPDVKIERFWTIFPLVFNEIEHEDDLYPPSDVELARHPQNEYNRSREALRQHRIAARPYYVVGGGLDEEVQKKLAQHADHEIIVVPTLLEGQKASDLVQAGPTAPIDPNLYEVEMVFNDMLRSVGSQEANFGSVSNGTATESSIAENSRSASLDDNIDDLDEMLTDLARSMGQLMLSELSKDTVIEIAGPGAVWPDMPMSREEANKDLILEIEVGSSGRPNQAAELAKQERGVPILLQVPGIAPAPVAKRLGALLGYDVEELIAEGLPSITAINAMMAKMGAGMGAAPGAEPTGDPATDPAQQGSEGATNAPSTVTNEPGPQPGFPAPAPVA
jgi:hypothetical protein